MEEEPPSIRPRGQKMRRPPSAGCWTVRNPQSTLESNSSLNAAAVGVPQIDVERVLLLSVHRVVVVDARLGDRDPTLRAFSAADEVHFHRLIRTHRKEFLTLGGRSTDGRHMMTLRIR